MSNFRLLWLFSLMFSFLHSRIGLFRTLSYLTLTLSEFLVMLFHVMPSNVVSIKTLCDAPLCVCVSESNTEKREFLGSRP